jgi:hypothetical protein
VFLDAEGPGLLETDEAQIKAGAITLFGPGTFWQFPADWAAPDLIGCEAVAWCRDRVSGDASFRLKETDMIDPCDDDSRREHSVTCQNESDVFNDQDFRHRSHLNRMRFVAQIDSGNQGVRIERTYDRFLGRQRARVFIDDRVVRYWYAPESNRVRRQGRDVFWIPSAFSSGKSSIAIEIDPVAGSPLWDVACYRVASVVPAKR